MKIYFVILSILCQSSICNAQLDSRATKHILNKINFFCVGAEIGITHLDVFSMNNLPQSISQNISFHAGLNNFIGWSGINLSSNNELTYELLLFEVGFGYQFDLGKNFQAVPKIGSGGGAGNVKNSEFEISKMLVLGMELNKALWCKGNNKILIGLSVEYRNFEYEPSNVFSSNDMVGLTFKLGYEYFKATQK